MTPFKFGDYLARLPDAAVAIGDEGFDEDWTGVSETIKRRPVQTIG